MNPIMIAVSMILVASLIGMSQGRKYKLKSNDTKEGYRNLDNIENAADVAWTDNCANGDDMLKIENLITQSNEGILRRFDKLDQCSCFNTCGGASPSTYQPGNNGQTKDLNWESILKKELGGLMQEMSKCCTQHDVGKGKWKEEITSIITPIATDQKKLKKDSDDLVKTVKQIVDQNQAQMKKQMEEWEAMSKQFQASQAKFKMEMERQAKKYSDLSNCYINPNIKVFGHKVGQEEYRITQSPIASRLLKMRKGNSG